ncbi:MAG TPA: biopolymer transporter ExbD [Pyrinomonadaceae bacterium]|jgi:biopolymer transport protein ExbD|nr:biopolymer transporter ExbD [Pyrinomonadaceae bacterium]
MSSSKEPSAKPIINVTPLIDVLLVLLIIFMVAVPLRPHRFIARLPSPPLQHADAPDPRTLVVIVGLDRTIHLNGLSDMGTLDDLSKLTTRLVDLFAERTKNRVYRDDMMARTDLPDEDRIEKTVFIRAPRSLSYGEVARLIDGLKGTGASSIGLQLDGLN